jgi:hypothetical protein
MISTTRGQRGLSTLVEVLIATGIMLMVWGFSTVLFRQAIAARTITSENLTNEQQARIAMARIDNSLSLASQAFNTPLPAANSVVQPMPVGTATQAIAFNRAQDITPSDLATPGGAPGVNYNINIIAYDPVHKQVDEYIVNPASEYWSNTPSPTPTILASNVTNFGIVQVTAPQGGTGGGGQYEVYLTINQIDRPDMAEQPFTIVDDIYLLNE